MIVDAEGNEVLDISSLEPWKFFLRGGDGLLYPVLTVTYKLQSVEIEWAKEDRDTILDRWRLEVDGLDGV